MWKYASKNIKASFQKGILRCNTVLSTKAPQGNGHYCLLKYSPALIESFNRYYGYFKSTYRKCSQTGEDKDGPKEKKTSFLKLDRNIFDALSWSSVLILGCYFLHPFSKKKLPNHCQGDSGFFKFLGCQKTVEYLVNSAGLQTFNYVLPEVKKTETLKNSGTQSNEHSTQNSESSKNQFSPLEKAHQKVVGAVSNWMGVQCTESAKYEKALEFFKHAAEQENAAGLFNLGICYERGLGTIQNFNEAAQLYQRAAHLGHATAMYNLGILYIQGFNGVEPDVDQARELFKAAAKLGQRDAEKALKLEKRVSESVPEENLVAEKNLTEKKETLFSELICDTVLNQASLFCPEDCKSCDMSTKNEEFELLSYLGCKEENATVNSDSGILDLSPQNEFDVLPVSVPQC